MPDDERPPIPFRRAAIIGLGLMGGSLALALRAGKLADAVVGYDAQPQSATVGLVDALLSMPAEAVTGADLIVLAVPTLAMREMFETIAPACAPDALITDLCSVKSPVVAWAEASLPQPRRFVGGHPMAGSEHSGPSAADATLYRGARWLLTPTATTDADAIERLCGLVRMLGAEPMTLAPDEHDRLVAGVSHLPLLAATALTQTLALADDWPDAARLAAGGFRDTTRVAAGDPIMARDICLANRDPILARLDAYLAELQTLHQALAAGDGEALEAIFRAAQASWRAWRT